MTDLKSDPQNARRHTDRNRATIRQSLTEIGPFRSIAVDGDNIIRAGNGVYEEAQAMGLKVRIVEAEPDELIAVKRKDLTGDKAERAALFDNRAAELSEWDADILELLREQSPEVIDGVFDGGELQSMIEEDDQLDKLRDQLESGSTSHPAFANRLGNDKAKIRPVLYAPQLAVFELALRETHNPNRGNALITVCQFYLENHHDVEQLEEQKFTEENFDEGQLDPK